MGETHHFLRDRSEGRGDGRTLETNPHPLSSIPHLIPILDAHFLTGTCCKKKCPLYSSINARSSSLFAVKNSRIFCSFSGEPSHLSSTILYSLGNLFLKFQNLLEKFSPVEYLADGFTVVLISVKADRNKLSQKGQPPTLCLSPSPVTTVTTAESAGIININKVEKSAKYKISLLASFS
jgi:hypothetical protein